jgi:hypothetical protein
MRTIPSTLFAAALAATAMFGCTNNNGTTLPPPGSLPQYTQIERLARPAVKEAFEAFANHDATNRSSPYNDPLLPGDIVSFMTTAAGRSTTIANAVQGVLIPDEMIADLSSSDPATYLGVETNGATGGHFGGRALTSDVIAISLGAIFGNTIPAVTGIADDVKENHCLSNDNVSSSGKHFTGAFPYLGPPQ